MGLFPVFEIIFKGYFAFIFKWWIESKEKEKREEMSQITLTSTMRSACRKKVQRANYSALQLGHKGSGTVFACIHSAEVPLSKTVDSYNCHSQHSLLSVDRKGTFFPKPIKTLFCRKCCSVQGFWTTGTVFAFQCYHISVLWLPLIHI